MKLGLLSLLLIAATGAYAGHHESEGTTDGAFITMMVQSDDPMAYIDALKSNSAAFEATSPTDSVEAEFQLEAPAPDHAARETAVPSADVQKAAPSPVEPRDTVTDQTSAEVIGNVIGALVRDTSGMTDSGRAVNDPRISPKPITQTQIITEQAQLFALPEGPPVSIIRQDIPRANNDPRGSRAQMATAE